MWCKNSQIWMHMGRNYDLNLLWKILVYYLKTGTDIKQFIMLTS